MLRLLRATDSERKLLIGVVHLLATPGAPRFGGDLHAVIARAKEDAQALVEGGCDAVIVENYGDAPFFGGPVPPETVAALALAVQAVIDVARDIPVGVNVLRNDARAALGICAASGARFVRVNVHTGAMVTDQGVIEGRAAETLRERARLCPSVAILADVHVKHATPLGGESLADAARDAFERGLADALVVTGRATGDAPDEAALEAVRAAAPAAPLFVGSGLDPGNAARLLARARGAIVGTALKHGGRTHERVERERVAALRALFST